ncbi:6,7-dimethyl-8-ribityllumazine synthase [Methanococcus maripaludis]|jgi:6,7-dimethyl-8-ribityllumazine synthase|uniref:6,7-dimethyl-8-ribityllumazine synthase n=3 Tax=Methanococcus maripaludis TaxID=39152 RepID=A0A2L1CAS0_METMI|nr:6,7-dimethyl-8-ribityllumazine synthase [Methanococcus maripaludis]MDK2928657.1 6,7-dimethyl-8-ribityllumazine synthase [Methanococcus sp.]AVB76444.1 6,7-dimethyl-8-ribityllumazine synthase [Methanococcus maripaludis]MBA2845840.1 6,7-dimethyl-8-ribityllumazine synthase [Methanococcus maripaludis]MBA2851896.1 6,7-dimethyl-8-ribityllumazine synthase [Methanococcus maripaludis]MBA2859155.1 6,7-dimethyl-8-ribityllumazine synthase [Methanococcus maripaludis]
MVNLGFVIAEFNRDLTFMMEKMAEEHAEFLGANVSHKIMVPGSFDMPLAIKTLLQKDDIDAVVTIGCVIEGDTEHDEIVVQNAARKIADLSLDFGKPVALGIAGPGMTRMQAEDRIDYGKNAVEAAVKMVKRLKEIQ